MADGLVPETLTRGATPDQLVDRVNGLIALIGGEITKSKERGEKFPQMERALEDLKVEIRDARAQLASAPNTSFGSDGEAELRMFTDEKKGVIWSGGLDEEGIYRKGLLDDDIEPSCEWHSDLRDLMEQRSLARICLPTGSETKRYAATPKLDKMIQRHLAKAPPALARIFSGASGAGGDWQETLVLPMLAEEARAPLAMESLFDVVPMGAKTVTLPFDSGVAPAYRKGQPTTNNPAGYTASESSTTSRTLSADSLAVMIPLFDDADEDSVIAARALLSRKVVDGLRYAREDCIINGDTQSTHQDTLNGWNPRSIYVTTNTFGGPDDHRRSWIGLRAHAFDASATRDASGDTTSWLTQTLKAARSALAAPHGVSGDLVYAASLEHYLNNIFVDTNVLTGDKFWDKASILTGQVVEVAGVKVVITEFLTSDLAATGLYTGSGSYTSGLLFNRKRFVRGERRGTVLEAAKDIRNGVTCFVATWRGTFRPMDAYTHKSVHLSYKL